MPEQFGFDRDSQITVGLTSLLSDVISAGLVERSAAGMCSECGVGPGPAYQLTDLGKTFLKEQPEYDFAGTYKPLHPVAKVVIAWRLSCPSSII
jgi:hypothetical protein